MTNPSTTTDRVLTEVLAERIRQDEKWGEQNHPDGTGPRTAAIVGMLCHADEAAKMARLACQSAARTGSTTWRLVLAEEVTEALAESDPAALRAELVQVAAVAVAWIEAIDRRTGAQPAAEPADDFTEACDAFFQIGMTPALQGLRTELRIEGRPPLVGRYAGAEMGRLSTHDDVLSIRPQLLFRYEDAVEQP